jgi:site-specific DNA recombinase
MAFTTDAVSGVATILSQGVATAHSRSVRQGMLLATGKGRHSGPVPPGYRVNPSGIRGVPLPDPAQAPAVGKAFDLVLAGSSLRQALPVVRKLGLSGRGRKPVSLATLARILTNPFYAGQVRHAGRAYPGMHEPIVSERDFRRAQILLAKRRCS